MATVDAFGALQAQLGAALEANRPGSTTPHVMIALPSYSVSESLLSHYGERIPSLEHRYLNAIVIPAGSSLRDRLHLDAARRARGRSTTTSTLAAAGAPRSRRADAPDHRGADDGTPRSVAARLVDRPDLIAAIRAHIGGRPGVHRAVERHRARGEPRPRPRRADQRHAPELRPLAFKSAGRRLFAAAGVPAPLGREDVRTTDDVVDAVGCIGRQRPLLAAS